MKVRKVESSVWFFTISIGLLARVTYIAFSVLSLKLAKRPYYQNDKFLVLDYLTAWSTNVNSRVLLRWGLIASESSPATCEGLAMHLGICAYFPRLYY